MSVVLQTINAAINVLLSSALPTFHYDKGSVNFLNKNRCSFDDIDQLAK